MPKGTIRLGRYEAEKGELPPLCMKCGAPATVRCSKKFAWHAQWVYVLILLGLLPMLIVGLIMTKRMRVDAPFCDEHKNHWSMRTWLLAGSFFGLAFLVVAALIVSANLPAPQSDTVGGMVCGGGFLLGICWLILFIVLDHTAIRVKEITDYSITRGRHRLLYRDGRASRC